MNAQIAVAKDTRTAKVAPDSEAWLHEPQAADDLNRALAWAVQHPAEDTNIDTLIESLPPAKHG
jgi:hypothetical protein